MPSPADLHPRERQIMDAVYRLGRASVSEVRREMQEPPSYSSVRAMMNTLEEKGHLRHERDGLRYVYLPTTPARSARSSALKHMVQTFFGGSAADAAAALLEMSERKLSDEDIGKLQKLIEQAERRETRGGR